MNGAFEILCKCANCGKIDELRVSPQFRISRGRKNGLDAVLSWECACGNKADLDGNFMGVFSDCKETEQA